MSNSKETIAKAQAGGLRQVEGLEDQGKNREDDEKQRQRYQSSGTKTIHRYPLSDRAPPQSDDDSAEPCEGDTNFSESAECSRVQINAA